MNPTTSNERPPSDAILTEIIRNGVLAVTEDMKTNLTRTAYNMIIYEALDFTVGLFTPEGDTVSIGLGLPMFIRGMSETVRAKARCQCEAHRSDWRVETSRSVRTSQSIGEVRFGV